MQYMNAIEEYLKNAIDDLQTDVGTPADTLAADINAIKTSVDAFQDLAITASPTFTAITTSLTQTAPVISADLQSTVTKGSGWTGSNPYTHSSGTEVLSYAITGGITTNEYVIVLLTVTGGSITHNCKISLGTSTSDTTGVVFADDIFVGSATVLSVKADKSYTHLNVIPDTSFTGTIVVSYIKKFTQLNIKSGLFQDYEVVIPDSTSIAIGNGLHVLNTGEYNTAFGKNALLYAYTGDGNTAFGYNSQNHTSTGNNNVSFGWNSLANNNNGGNNVAFGSYALTSNKSGDSNIAIGVTSLYSNISGGGNIAMGYDSLNSNIGEGLSLGSYNIAIGSNSLQYVVNGLKNIAIGYNSGKYYGTGNDNLTAGTNSIFIGYDSRPEANSQDNQIVIGYMARGKGTNTVKLGNDSITSVYTTGNLNIGASLLSDWNTAFKAIEFYQSAIMAGNTTSDIYILANAYNNTGGYWKYKTGATASQIRLYDGAIYFNTAVYGSAGSTIPWTTALTITSTGTITSGVTSSNASISALTSTNNFISSASGTHTSNGFSLDLSGCYVGSTFTNSGTIVGIDNKTRINTASHVGILTKQIGLYSSVGATTSGTGGTITTAYGVQSRMCYESPITITNAYQYYGDYYYASLAGTVTNKWGLYLSGCTNNYVEGYLETSMTQTDPTLTADLQGTPTLGANWLDATPLVYTHLTGSTEVLSFPITDGIVSGDYVQAVLTQSGGDSTNNFTVILGTTTTSTSGLSIKSDVHFDATLGVKSTGSYGYLNIIPDSNFSGTVTITSIKRYSALNKKSIRFQNTDILLNTQASVAIGNGGYIATGANNTFIGLYSGYYNMTGYDNACLGLDAGRLNTTGYQNTFIGSSSGRGSISGYNDTCVGFKSGYSNTTGYKNVFIGSSVGYSNTTGSDNTFLGHYSGYNNIAGTGNTFIGLNSGMYYSTSSANTTNTNCIHIGNTTRASSATADNEIVIGFDTVGKGSNTIKLGNSAITSIHTIGHLNIGAGTFSSWNADSKSVEFFDSALMARNSNSSIYILSNAYYNTAGTWRYKVSSVNTALYLQSVGSHTFAVASGSGKSAGDEITWTIALEINNTGTVTLSGATVPDTAVGGIFVKQNTDPTVFSTADQIGLYATSGANCTLGIVTEQAVATETVTSDRTLTIKINGTAYKLCLKA